MGISMYDQQYVVDTKEQYMPREVKDIFLEQKRTTLKSERIYIFPRLSK